MICLHTNYTTKEYNACNLNLYGGRPSHGTCKLCVERGENNPQFALRVKANLPNLQKQAKTLANSLLKWTYNGLAATPPDILAAREATCKVCPEWDAEAFNKTGRCRKCGCSTWAKLRMATERCPIGKWEAVEKTLE